MISQIFMAKSAMFALQRQMQVITNNISNSQTIGFKRRRVEMESLFPLVLERSISEFDEVTTGAGRKRKKYIEYGQGVSIVGISKNFATGTIEVTNQQLDVAIQGKGLFQFRLPDGRFAYGRAGNFHMDSDGNLLNQDGHPLEPAIRIPRNVTEVIINEEGRVFARVNDEPQPTEVGQILLANFPNDDGLKDIGQTLFVETEASGEPTFEVPAKSGMGELKQRSLEFSNVNIIEEMMKMLITQRTFELIVKAMNSSDAMLKVASDLK